jgi:hypothetical protein
MAFDLKSFAAQVRPSGRRSSPEPFSNSIFDAGSPQYVRPEDLYLDIQRSLFNLERKSKEDLGDIDPSDFRVRWLAHGTGGLTLKRVGAVSNEDLADSVMGLLRCPKRSKQLHPTLLPIIPELGFYKNIGQRMPNFLSDQLRPALSFADNVGFSQRIHELKNRIYRGTHKDDSLMQLAAALLPPVAGSCLQPISPPLEIHDGPLLRDFLSTPSLALPVCKSFIETIDSLISLEPCLPRILWSRWLTAALRLWLPLFFLKRCAVTSSAAQIIKNVLAYNTVQSPAKISLTLYGANCLLRGSNEWLNQLTPIIQSYVRARFEISILLELSNLLVRLKSHAINPEDPAQQQKVIRELSLYEVVATSTTTNPLPDAEGLFASVKLSMPGDTGSRRLPFDVWLDWIVANRSSMDALAKVIGADDVPSLIERVYSFVRPEYEPLKNGFTKNMREFVVYNLGAPLKADRDPEFPDEYNLIYRGEGGRRSRQIMIQPGPELLALLVQIVSHQAKSRYQTTAKLSDLLDLFDNLGVDFRSSPDDFEALKIDLLKHGLLQSSADAAEAASLKPSFSL